jgi:uncharacterized protein YqgV (UPF0045/DUF77 family)
MKASVEISLYPLLEDYVPVIETFLERLNAHPDLTVLAGTMSTRVIGDYDRVFEVLRDETKRVHGETPHVVLVAKIVAGDLSPREGGRYS